MAMAKAKATTKALAQRRAKSSARKSVKARSAVKAKTKRSGYSEWPKQTFVVSHPREKDYKQGFRSYAKYRDLGVAKATKGAVVAHVIRLLGRCDPVEVS